MDNAPVELLVKHNFDIIAKALGQIAKTLGSAKQNAGEIEKPLKNMERSLHNTNIETGKINVGFKAFNAESKKAKAVLDGLAIGGEKVKQAFGWTKTKIGAALGVASLGGMISGTRSYREELLSLRNTFQSMSDATGSTNAAMSTYFRTMGQTKANNATIIASMQGVEQQGVKVGKTFDQLTLLGADLSHATGVSADTWTSLNAKMSFSWKTPVENIKQMSSTLVASGLNAAQLTQVINGVNDVMDKLGGYAKDGAKSAVALTAGFTGAVTAMTKFGISAQKATEFMNKLLDPEALQDNMLLLSKAGISYSDFTNMMTSDKGKETFFDKLGKGLPQVARQLSQIQDPIARMNFGKSLGLSAEMVQKLATAGPGEMQRIMRQAVEEAKNKDALEKKKKAAAEASAKLDEKMHQIKMQLYSQLLPIFERNIGPFLGLLSKMFARGGELFGFIGTNIEKVFNNFRPFLHALLDGKWSDVGKTLATALGNTMAQASDVLAKTIFPAVKTAFLDVLPELLKGVRNGIWLALKEAPILTMLFLAYKARGAVDMIWKWRMYNLEKQHIKETQQGFRGVVSAIKDQQSGTTTIGSNRRRTARGRASAARRAARAQTGRGNTDFLSGDLFGDGGGGTVAGKRGLRAGRMARFTAMGSRAGSALAMGGRALGAAGAVFSLGSGVVNLMSDNETTQQEGGGDIGAAGGALAGAKAGALIGAFGGPIGVAIGTVAGGIIGAMAGTAIGKAIVKSYQEQKKENKMSFYESERQMEFGKLNLKDIGSRTKGADYLKSQGVSDERLAAMRYKEVSTMKQSAPSGTTLSDASAEKDFSTITTGIFQARKEEAKYYEERLKMAADGRIKLSEEEKQRMQQVVAFQSESAQMEVMRMKSELEMKKLSGVALNAEEENRLRQLEQQSKTLHNEMVNGDRKRHAQLAALYKYRMEDLSKISAKGLGNVMNQLGETIIGGASVMMQGLSAANQELAKVGMNIGGVFGMGAVGSYAGAGMSEWTKNFSKTLSTDKTTQMRQLMEKAKDIKNKADIAASGGDVLAQLQAIKGAGGATLYDNMIAAIGGTKEEATDRLQKLATKNRDGLIESLKRLAEGFEGQAIAQKEQAALQASLQKIGNGYGKAIVENTKPKTDRAKVSEWVDFLRSSGIVEAQVAN